MGAETETDWPYDADRDDPLTAHRIAVTCSHPGWYYLVSFDRESEARPTDAETAMLVSYLDHYKDHWYGNSGFRQQMEQRPLDTDGGANGVIFHKWGPGDWGYRRQSYTMGPLFFPGWPGSNRERGPFSLVALMDFMHTIGDDGPMAHWVEWKAAHPDVFGDPR
jgi:hypothetical protein